MVQGQNNVTLTRAVLKCIKRYDIQNAKQELQDCDALVDPELVEALVHLTDALEIYRPHLPNYLFYDMEHRPVMEWEVDDENLEDLGSPTSTELRRKQTEAALSDLLTESNMGSFHERTMIQGIPTETSPESRSVSPADRGLNDTNSSKVFNRPGPMSFNLSPTNSMLSSISSASSARHPPSTTVAAKKLSANPLSRQQTEVVNPEENAEGDSRPSVLSMTRTLSMKRKTNSSPSSPILPASYVGRISIGVLQFDLPKSFEDGMQLHHQLQRKLLSFTDKISTATTSTHASVHNMIGDTVFMTWNATHRVASPESKAVKCLLQLMSAAKAEGIRAHGAVGTGSSFCYYTMMGSQLVPAVHAPWKCRVTSCLELASKFDTLIVDEKTASTAAFTHELRGVDELTYIVPHVSSGGRCTTPSATVGEEHDLVELHSPTSPNFFDKSDTVALVKFIAYEAVAERKAADQDEWMYQLQQMEQNSDNDKVTMALQAINRGDNKKALAYLADIHDSEVATASLVVRLAARAKHGTPHS